MRKHIMFVNLPRPSHVNPTLPIVAALVRRGHRVTYATSEQFADRITRIGAHCVPIPSVDLGGPEPKNPCQAATAAVEEVRRHHEHDRPDVIIYDLVALGGRVLAHKWNVPAIKISPDFAFSEDVFPSQIRLEQVRDWGFQLSREADHFFRCNGVPSSGYMFHREKLNIHLCPRDFDPYGFLADESCLYVGRCPGEQFHIGDWNDDFGGDRPIAAIVPSTTFARDERYFNLCVDSLAELPWNFILFLAPDVKLTSPLRLPENFRAVGCSPSKALSRATMLVCMGGAMTVAEGIYHGLPLLMTSCGIPFFEAICDVWVDLGFGVHVKHAEMKADRIRTAFIQVAESAEIRAKVRRMQRRVRREPGAEEAANGIEEFIETYGA